MIIDSLYHEHGDPYLLVISYAAVKGTLLDDFCGFSLFLSYTIHSLNGMFCIFAQNKKKAFDGDPNP